MYKKCRPFLLRTLVQSSVLALLSSPVFAASPADIEAASQQADQLQRLQQQQILQDQRNLRPKGKSSEGVDINAISPKVDASQAEGKCRLISDIQVKGVTQLLTARLQEITHPFVGRCLGAPDVEQLLGEITRAYMLRGFVTTRVYLPAQDLSTGKLQLLVVEGRIEKIQLDTKGRSGFRLGNTIPAQVGDLLNLRDLEQGIDQINRLQSNNASFDIAPGSAPGMSDVIVRNEPGKFYRWNFSADNQGSAATGKNQVGVNFSSDNALGISDFIMLTHRESLPLKDPGARSVSDALMMTVPYGYNTFSYNGSASTYRSTLQAPSGLALLSNGDNTTNAFGWDRLLYRNQSTRFNLRKL